MTRILTIYVLSGALAVLVVAVPSSADAIEIQTPQVTTAHVNVQQVKTSQANSHIDAPKGAAIGGSGPAPGPTGPTQSGPTSPLYGQANNTNEINGPGELNLTPRPKATPKVNSGTKNEVTVKGAQ
jgi:hypothetical protein